MFKLNKSNINLDFVGIAGMLEWCRYKHYIVSQFAIMLHSYVSVAMLDCKTTNWWGAGGLVGKDVRPVHFD